MKINQISRFSEKPEDEAAVISNWLAMISCHQTGHVNPVLSHPHSEIHTPFYGSAPLSNRETF